MITKEQALDLPNVHLCQDGKTCKVWRRNGMTQTWARDPQRFRMPVKFGLYNYGAVTNTSPALPNIFAPSDCPACHGKKT